MKRENMSFEEEMDLFFKGYDRHYRELVECDIMYQESARQKDAVRCQEMATEIIHGRAWRAKRHWSKQAKRIKDTTLGKAKEFTPAQQRTL
jgi:hypothetical protein